VLLDDHHYFSDDNSHIPPSAQKLPAGTSTYQAAWYLDDVSDSDSDILDDEDRDGDIAMDADADPADNEGMTLTNAEDGGMTEAQPSEYPASEMNIDEVPLEANEEARQTGRIPHQPEATGRRRPRIPR